MEFQFANQSGFYQGKVRDVYYIADDYLVMVASNRISAFDVILPKPIPYKGQVLNKIAAHMLEATKDICPNWLLETPTPDSSLGLRCKPFKIEMVVRGNLVGHGWRTYNLGKRTLCGVSLPENMVENQFFSTPIITPSTKAETGHDEDISREEILARSLASEQDYKQLEAYALALFERGKEMANKQGLILADTKYEFGKLGETIYLMDEIHTPDSSRYFYAERFEEKVAAGERPAQLSKEFVREWLIANAFMGKEGQQVPEMTEQWIETISHRYIELYEKLIGQPFERETMSRQEVFTRIEHAVKNL